MTIEAGQLNDAADLLVEHASDGTHTHLRFFEAFTAFGTTISGHGNIVNVTGTVIPNQANDYLLSVSAQANLNEDGGGVARLWIFIDGSTLGRQVFRTAASRESNGFGGQIFLTSDAVAQGNEAFNAQTSNLDAAMSGAPLIRLVDANTHISISMQRGGTGSFVVSGLRVRLSYTRSMIDDTGT